MNLRPQLSGFAELLRPSALRQLLSAPPAQLRLSLAGGLPPDEAMPFRAIGDVIAELIAATDASALQYSSAEGDRRLRDRIATWVSDDLDAPIDPTSIVVTAGTQQAIDLLCRVLLNPGDDAVVESPTYVGALRVIVPTGARVTEVPVDDHGLDTSKLEAHLHHELRPKLVYIVSNFSNPSAATMSLERRQHLQLLADKYGFVVIEDDQYGRLRFAGHHVRPIASLSDISQGNVAYVSGFSKVVAPGLRVGFCVLPEWLRGAVTLAKQATDLASPSIGQRIVSSLLDRPGWFASHIDGLRQMYRSRAEALMEGVSSELDGKLAVRQPEGGMFTWASIQQTGIDARQLAQRSLQRGLVIMPGSEFSLGNTFADSLRLSFSTSTPAELTEACTILRAAFDDR